MIEDRSERLELSRNDAESLGHLRAIAELKVVLREAMAIGVSLVDDVSSVKAKELQSLDVSGGNHSKSHSWNWGDHDWRQVHFIPELLNELFILFGQSWKLLVERREKDEVPFEMVARRVFS